MANPQPQRAVGQAGGGARRARELPRLVAGAIGAGGEELRTRRARAEDVEAIGLLIEAGTELGRPLADRIQHSRLTNLKELRPGSSGRSEIRILYIFDPRRNAVLLVAGDKAGQWAAWYRKNIPLAEDRYEAYLKHEGNQ